MRRLPVILVMLAFLLTLAVPVRAGSNGKFLGTFSIAEGPYHYANPVTFTWELAKRPQYPTVGVFCDHPEDPHDNYYRYLVEYFVPRGLTGSLGVLISNDYSGSLSSRDLDYSRPANCFAFMWDERGGGQQPVVITNGVSFEVLP